MKSFLTVAVLAVACLACSVAEAHGRRVTIVRRQRIVAQPQAVILQRPLQLVQPSVVVPHVYVPSQQLIIVR